MSNASSHASIKAFMFSEIRSLSKHFVIYGLGNVLSKAITFALIPLYTRYLQPSDYGTLELIDLTILITYLVITAGVYDAVIRFYNFYEDSRDKKEVVSSAFVFSFIVAGIFCSWFAFDPRLFVRLAFNSIDPDYVEPFRVVFVTLFADYMSVVAYAYILAEKKSILYLCVSLTRLILGIVLSIYFLARGHGVLGVLYANAINSSIVSVVVCSFVLRQVGFSVSKNKIVALLKFGLPLVPAGLGLFILNFADRFFLQRFSTLTEVGIYALGYKFGLVIHALVTTPFMQIWGAQKYEVAKVQHSAAVFARVFTYYLFMLTFASLTVSVLGKDAIAMMAPPAYFTAYQVIPVIALSYVFMGVFRYFATAFELTNKTIYLAMIQGITVLLNLVFNLWFIPQYGAMGAAAATLLSFVVLGLLTYCLSLRVYRLEIEPGRVLKIIGIGFVFFVILNFIDAGSEILGLVLKGALILLYPIVLYYLSFFELAETLKMKEIASAAVFRIQNIGAAHR
jgi:O-antigen/teichoic acid export membrane protein